MAMHSHHGNGKPHMSNVSAILTHAEIIYDELEQREVDAIARALKGAEYTHQQIAELFAEELVLPKEALPALERVISRIAAESLDVRARHVRNVTMQSNARRGVEMDSDKLSDYGRSGATLRVKQYIESGKNGMGHDIWNEKQLSALWELIHDPKCEYPAGDRYEGRVNFHIVAELMAKKFPGEPRTVHSVRKKSRELLEKGEPPKNLLEELLQNGDLDYVWSTEELTTLDEIVHDPASHHINGPFTGNPNYLLVEKTFSKRCRKSKHGLDAIRKKGRLLWRQNGNGESEK